MFYVYEWYIIKTNEIFYVGKGCKNRYKNGNKKSKKFMYYFTNYECASRIIKYFKKEEDAFSYERVRIIELKKSNQAKANVDLGGHGGNNSYWTEEKRKNQSINNPMKKEEQRKRMSINNPMKNKEIAKKVALKISRKVIINGIEYKSVYNASNYFKVAQGTIKKWCKKGINPNKQLCRYADEEQHIYKGKRYNKTGCKPIIYKGKLYECSVDIAKELGLKSYSTVLKWCRKGFDPQGNECRFENDNTNYIYKPYINGEKLKKPIKVNGIIYPSKKEAEIQLGLKIGVLGAYIRGERKNNKYICEYVNQQPSQTKSDK